MRDKQLIKRRLKRAAKVALIVIVIILGIFIGSYFLVKDLGKTEAQELDTVNEIGVHNALPCDVTAPLGYTSVSDYSLPSSVPKVTLQSPIRLTYSLSPGYTLFILESNSDYETFQDLVIISSSFISAFFLVSSTDNFSESLIFPISPLDGYPIPYHNFFYDKASISLYSSLLVLNSSDSSLSISGSVLSSDLHLSCSPLAYYSYYMGTIAGGGSSGYYDQGYKDGLDDGKEQGYQDGYKDGNDKGFSDGFSVGNQIGYEDGYAHGNSAGYDKGYDKGYYEGLQEGSKEEYSFSNLLFTVLEAPVTLVKSMFNFEIFGINFSNLILFILTIGIVAFVVRWLLR